MKPRIGRYTLELTIVMLLYTATLITANVVDTDGWSKPALAALWLAPAFCSILIVPVVLRLMATVDEVQRRVVAESSLVSMVVVGFATFSYAFIEEPLELPAVGLVWVWPALMAVAGLAQIPIRMRLR